MATLQAPRVVSVTPPRADAGRGNTRANSGPQINHQKCDQVSVERPLAGPLLAADRLFLMLPERQDIHGSLVKAGAALQGTCT
ncbi:hypothetical protein BaRGS_00019196 [Batillaria attramentaria]|uniref:Uncharacterized protein n=1 Tax=Batillaria attramentaria TaxID=370345 RepID=A0ABD0KQU1_9CAEN